MNSNKLIPAYDVDFLTWMYEAPRDWDLKAIADLIPNAYWMDEIFLAYENGTIAYYLNENNEQGEYKSEEHCGAVYLWNSFQDYKDEMLKDKFIPRKFKYVPTK